MPMIGPSHIAGQMVQDGIIDEEHRQYAEILLHILEGAQNADTIATRTKLNRDKVVRPALRRLRCNSLLNIKGELLLEEPFIIGFGIGILVAMGLLERAV